MSESYKTHSDGLYFVSFSVVGWIDVEAGFVNHPQDWRLSSANEESPIKTDETEPQDYKPPKESK